MRACRRGAVWASALVLLLAASGTSVAARGSAPEPSDPVLVTDVEITGSGPWTSWFGDAPNRTVAVTLLNSGFGAIEPTVVVTAGGTRFATEVTPELAAGEKRTVETRVEFDPLAFGEYTVVVTVEGAAATPGYVEEDVVLVPWGLLALAAIACIGAVAAGVGALRRRRHRRAVRAEAQPATETPVLLGAPAVAAEPPEPEPSGAAAAPESKVTEPAAAPAEPPGAGALPELRTLLLHDGARTRRAVVHFVAEDYDLTPAGEDEDAVSAAEEGAITTGDAGAWSR